MPKRVTYAVKEIEQGFLSVTDMTRYAGISRDVQQRLRNDGLLPFYTPFGVKIMYKKAEIDKIFERYKTPVRRTSKLKPIQP